LNTSAWIAGSKEIKVNEQSNLLNPSKAGWNSGMMYKGESKEIAEGTLPTVSEFLQDWLSVHQRKLKPKTIYQYQNAIAKHITPAIGDVRLDALRLRDVENYYTWLQEHGVSNRMVRLIHNILHCALEKAVKYDYILKNPTTGADLPRYTHEEMKILDPSEVNRFLVTAQGTSSYALFYLAVTTGMRMGELFGLKWSDVNWQRATIYVQRQIQFIPGKGYHFADTKTRYGKRIIDLSNGAIDALQKEKIRQETMRLYVGDRWQENDLVFPNSLGRPRDATNTRIALNRILKASGVKKIRFHDLRHTAASILLNSNVSLIKVSRMLGHSKPSVTLDIYTHLISDETREAAVVMDRLVAPILVEIPKAENSVGKNEMNLPTDSTSLKA
jgi:integrase